MAHSPLSQQSLVARFGSLELCQELHPTLPQDLRRNFLQIRTDSPRRLVPLPAQRSCLALRAQTVSRGPRSVHILRLVGSERLLKLRDTFTNYIVTLLLTQYEL